MPNTIGKTGIIDPIKERQAKLQQPTAPAPAPAPAPVPVTGQVWDTAQKKWTTPTSAAAIAGKPVEPGKPESLKPSAPPTLPPEAPTTQPSVTPVSSQTPQQNQVWDTAQKKWVEKGTAAAISGKPVEPGVPQPTPEEVTKPQPTPEKQYVAESTDQIVKDLQAGKLTADSAEWKTIPYELRKQAYTQWKDPNRILNMLKNGQITADSPEWQRLDYDTRRTAYKQWEALNKQDQAIQEAAATEDTSKIYSLPGDSTKYDYEGFVTKLLSNLQSDNANHENELKKLADDYTTKTQEIDDQIEERKKTLSREELEIRDNPWITQSSLDKRINVAREKAKSDIDLLISDRASLTDQYNVQNSALQSQWERERTAVNDYVTLAGNIENMNIASQNAETAQIEAQTAQLKEYNVQQNQLRDDARDVIGKMVDTFGAKAFDSISPEMLSLAGYDEIDTATLSGLYTQKDLDRISSAKKSAGSKTEFETWIEAYKAGDQDTLNGIKEYQQSKANATTGSKMTNISHWGGSFDDKAVDKLPAELQAVIANNSAYGAAVMLGEQIIKNPDGTYSRTTKVLPFVGSTFESKYNTLINNNGNARSTPIPGSVALFHAKDKNGKDIGHLGIVKEVNSDNSFTVWESGWKNGMVTSDRKVKMTDATLAGFWVPPAHLNDILGQYQQLDKVFDNSMQWKLLQNASGVNVTPENFLDHIFSGDLSKSRNPETEQYIMNRMQEKDSIINRMSDGQIKTLLNSISKVPVVGSLLTTPTAKYDWGEITTPKTTTTKTKLTTTQIAKIKTSHPELRDSTILYYKDLPTVVQDEMFSEEDALTKAIAEYNKSINQ